MNINVSQIVTEKLAQLESDGTKIILDPDNVDEDPCFDIDI